MKHYLILLFFIPLMLPGQDDKALSLKISQTSPDTLYTLSWLSSVNYRAAEPLKVQELSRDSLTKADVQSLFDEFLINPDTVITEPQVLINRLEAVVINAKQQDKLNKRIYKKAEKIYQKFLDGEIKEEKTIPETTLSMISEVCPEQSCSPDKDIRVNFYNDGRDPDCTCVKKR